ncbi:MAG: DNA helicase [Solibacillus sp.]|uniref:DNA helicase n=1 Tax=unclassified Solibacillus TaxID=2637870 RepID=UPI0030FB73EE
MTSILTCIVAACVLALLLKFLHLFHFIKWSPVGFTKKLGIEDITAFEKWLIIILIFFVIALLLYYLFVYIPIRPDIASILLGLAVAILVEWIIYRYPLELSSFKKLSIPFIVVIMIMFRFIIESAAYLRNNLVR